MIVALAAAAASASSWPLVQLNDELLRHDSATQVLQAMCDRRAPAGTRIRARRVAASDVAASVDAAETAAVRRELRVGRDEPLRHRRVELLCGEAVFSRADNWYLPARLTPRMNEALDGGETPFGVAVKALRFRRKTLSVTFSVQDSGDTLQHRATLATPDGRPFSYLVETYDGGALSAP